MSKSPYYDIEIKSSQTRLTELISSFTYEDCIDEDDLVKFTMHDLNREFIDSPDFIEGVDILYQFGYLSYKIIDKATATIKTLKIRYAQTIDIEVVALDAGNSMKQSTSCKIWKNMKASDMVAKIVKRYGLDLISVPTKKVYNNLPQGNRTDFEFIRYLTTIEDSGTYIFYVKDQKAYFVKRDLTVDPSILFQYGDPDGTSKIISFDVNQEDTGKTKAKTKATTTGIDPLTKKKIKEDGAAGEALGDYSINSEGDLSDLEASNTTGKNIPHPAKSVEDAKNVASKAKKDAELEGLTATLVIEGDTLVRAGDVIGITGVAKKHEGNWYVKKVAHSITTGGYIVTLYLQKNATKQPITANTDKVNGNDKTGSKDPDPYKNLLIVKADGSIVDPKNGTVTLSPAQKNKKK